MSYLQTVVTLTALSAATLLGALLYRKNRKQQVPKVWRPVGTITKLHLYPLKSGHRLEIGEAECSEFGVRHTSNEEKALQLRDRCFVIYGESNGEFKTARTFPKIMLIEVHVHDEEHVVFDAPDMRSLYVKIPNEQTCDPFEISFHRDERIFALDCGDEAATWISRYIHGNTNSLRVAYHNGALNHSRNIQQLFKEEISVYKQLGNEATGLYSDLSAMLLINQASVDDLNTRLASEDRVAVENFRPNIVVEGPGCAAYVENDWDWIRIGDEVICRNVIPCTRCIMTTLNPESGERNKNREPLKTLEKYHTVKHIRNIEMGGDCPVMGCNLGVIQKGVIKLNDTVYVA